MQKTVKKMIWSIKTWCTRCGRETDHKYKMAKGTFRGYEYRCKKCNQKNVIE